MKRSEENVLGRLRGTRVGEAKVLGPYSEKKWSFGQWVDVGVRRTWKVVKEGRAGGA